MNNNPYLKQYKNTQVVTAKKEQILVMLYEAAIRHVKKGVEAIEQNDLTGKGAAIGKAHDIVAELLNTLNFEVGGQVAKDLERLYVFMIDQLIKANLENSKECLLSVQRCMETLLDGWKGAIDQLKAGEK